MADGGNAPPPRGADLTTDPIRGVSDALAEHQYIADRPLATVLYLAQQLEVPVRSASTTIITRSSNSSDVVTAKPWGGSFVDTLRLRASKSPSACRRQSPSRR